MASPIAPMRPPLSSQELEEVINGVTEHRVQSLMPVWLPLPAEEESDKVVYGSCYPLMSRASGFMMIFPLDSGIKEQIVGLAADSGLGIEPAFYEGVVDIIGPRAKALGSAAGVLVDLPWEFVENLVKAVMLRGSAARTTTVRAFKVEDVVGKPAASSSLELANQWISSELDEDSAQEYLTGVEAEEELQPSSPAQDEAETLRARVAQLESELKAAQSNRPAMTTASPHLPTRGKHAQEQRLFVHPTPKMSAVDLKRLQQLAGTPPDRLGQVVQKRVEPPAAAVATADASLAEIEKEVDEGFGQMLDPRLLEDPSLDPMQKLMLTQVQQNSLLLQKILGSRANTDPMANLLSSGGANESGSSSSGAKGCVARDMFLRTIQDHSRVAEVVRANALQELGISPDREDKDLMKTYFERRVPLADNRLLAHVAQLAAEGWSIAAASHNIEMQGFLGRMMMFVEQVALDSNKIELGWLMAGFAEPNSHLQFSVKRTPGLKPFTRLASPIWVSANLAFLRDLDYLQARMASVGSAKPTAALKEADDSSPAKPPKKPPKQKAKGKGKGKEGESAEA